MVKEELVKPLSGAVPQREPHISHYPNNTNGISCEDATVMILSGSCQVSLVPKGHTYSMSFSPRVTTSKK